MIASMMALALLSGDWVTDVTIDPANDRRIFRVGTMGPNQAHIVYTCREGGTGSETISISGGRDDLRRFYDRPGRRFSVRIDDGALVSYNWAEGGHYGRLQWNAEEARSFMDSLAQAQERIVYVHGSRRMVFNADPNLPQLISEAREACGIS